MEVEHTKHFNRRSSISCLTLILETIFLIRLDAKPYRLSTRCLSVGSLRLHVLTPRIQRKPRLTIGVPVLVVGLAMMAAASIYLGPRVPNGTPPPCFPESCPEIGYFAVIGVVGFIVAFWGGMQTFFALLARAGAVQARVGPLPTIVLGMSQEDQNILSFARETHDRTRFPKRTEIEKIGWLDGQPWYWCRFKRHGLSKSVTLVFAAGLRGRLEQADWRVLLEYWFQRPRVGQMLMWFGGFLLFLFLPLAGGIVISTVYGIHASQVYAQLVATPIVILDMIYLFSRAKILALKHDMWVASSIGRESLLGVFKKIDSLQLPEIENAKGRRGWMARLWPMPNITERIRNLE